MHSFIFSLFKIISALNNKKNNTYTYFSFDITRDIFINVSILIDINNKLLSSTFFEMNDLWLAFSKYMSPRSERSLSRNDSGLTSRLLTDEGTQTPRIREYDDLIVRTSNLLY